KKFINGLIPEYKHDEFQFILISEFIKTTGEFANVKSIPRLIPPGQIVGLHIDGDKKAYKKHYFEYLKDRNIEAFIAIFVQAAVINDIKIVLLCSKSEEEYKYLKYICEYIEAVFKVKTYSWKEYEADPDKANKVSNKDEVAK